MTRNVKLLRNTSFGLVAFIVLLLAAATFVETVYGSRFVAKHVYGSAFFVLLWGLVALSSVAYLIMRKIVKRLMAFLLHMSFVVILIGAFITHVWGEQGTLHLRHGNVPSKSFYTADGDECELPFEISLKNFELAYYPGTVAPMDFISTIAIREGDTSCDGVVSMNNIYTYHNYRFYQSTYDSDGLGSTLAVYHDPYGIAVTYIGYGLMLLSMLIFFFDRNSTFRKLLHHPALHKAGVCVALAAVSLPAFSADVPKALPEATAARFGDMYVYYNGRICPMQTLARDFTVKLYGKASYKGLTPEQVLTGWFFYYDDWKYEPIVRIKSREVRGLLGIEGDCACLTDFFCNTGYKLKSARQSGSDVSDLRGVSEADEKFSLISAVCTGNAFKIYPYNEGGAASKVTWFSVTDRLPEALSHEQWSFMRFSMNYVAEQVARKDFAEVDTLISKIKKYQEKEAAEVLPANVRFKAEKLYNSLEYTRQLAMACLAIGILSFFFFCWRMMRLDGRCSRINLILVLLTALVLIYVVLLLTLRGIVGGHFPASNGFETMQLMAASVLVLSLLAYRKFEAVISFGFMLCGLAMLVAMFGEANPSVTQLMPVLSSPLMSIHVALIMIAYSLFGFAMFNGIAAVVLRYSRCECALQIERLQVISRLLLYPAVFLLAIGIFIGAVWANVSWGRYWGWDPKETWALITLLVYAASFHFDSLPALRRPMFFHWFTIIAFFCVLITYFGANFIMVGLHSYA